MARRTASPDRPLPASVAAHPAPGRFAAEATSTLCELRRATAGVLNALGGLDRAVRVASRLGLDRSLAWKLWKVAQGPGACPSVAHIPGRQGFRRFIDAAQAAGVPRDRIRAAREAFERYTLLAATHAGDRAASDTLLGALSHEGRRRHELAIRRDGFRANAAFLGVQAAAMYQLDVLLPRDASESPDVIRVRGHFGLMRSRENVPWLLTRSTLVNADGPSPRLARVALKTRPYPDRARSDDGGLPVLLPEFSSHPLPPVRRRVVAGVTVEDELLPGPVGRTGAVDVVTGERVMQMPRRRAQQDAVTMSVTTPCERLCYDVAAPADLFAAEPSLRVHSTVQSEHPYLRGPEFCTIPVIESLEALGPARAAPPTPEVPRHAELLDWTLHLADQPADSLLLWRVRMRFPPVPSCVAVTYRLAPDS